MSAGRLRRFRQITSDYPERPITGTVPGNRPTGTTGYPDASNCALSPQAVARQGFQACTLVAGRRDRPPDVAGYHRRDMPTGPVGISGG